MNREDIIRMAREAGLRDCTCAGTKGCLERFAALVADAEAKRIHDEGMVTIGHMREQIAAEREACAKVCDDHERQRCEAWAKVLTTGGEAPSASLSAVAAAIRARGQA